MIPKFLKNVYLKSVGRVSACGCYVERLISKKEHDLKYISISFIEPQKNYNFICTIFATALIVIWVLPKIIWLYLTNVYPKYRIYSKERLPRISTPAF